MKTQKTDRAAMINAFIEAVKKHAATFDLSSAGQASQNAEATARLTHEKIASALVDLGVTGASLQHLTMNNAYVRFSKIAQHLATKSFALKNSSDQMRYVVSMLTVINAFVAAGRSDITKAQLDQSTVRDTEDLSRDEILRAVNIKVVGKTTVSSQSPNTYKALQALDILKHDKVLNTYNINSASPALKTALEVFCKVK